MPKIRCDDKIEYFESYEFNSDEKLGYGPFKSLRILIVRKICTELIEILTFFKNLPKLSSLQLRKLLMM
jgi:hypothetical protein